MHPHRNPKIARRRRSAGFTLIELLIVISIVALLIALLLPALSRARTMAKAATGLSALRQTQMAYLAYADEHQGFLLIGYKSGLTAKDRDGNDLPPPIPNRYPWRLIPYLGWDWDALYYDREPEEDKYTRSIFPRFGLNSWFLGGDTQQYGFHLESLEKWGPFYARRIEDSPVSSRQIVFADSVYSRQGEPFDPVDGDGFYQLHAPYFQQRNWNLHDPTTAKDVGYVAERWDGLATVTFMDGHSERRSLDQLDDMRLWAPLARSASYVVGSGK